MESLDRFKGGAFTALLFAWRAVATPTGAARRAESEDEAREQVQADGEPAGRMVPDV